jgi:hypothetical protein
MRFGDVNCILAYNLTGGFEHPKVESSQYTSHTESTKISFASCL